jgi:hypothetical protein
MPDLSNLNPTDDHYGEMLYEFHAELAHYNNLINKKLDHLHSHSKNIGFDIDAVITYPSHPSIDTQYGGELMIKEITFKDVTPNDFSQLFKEHDMPVPDVLSLTDIDYLYPILTNINNLKSQDQISNEDILKKTEDVKLRLTELEKLDPTDPSVVTAYKETAGELSDLNKLAKSQHHEMSSLISSLTAFTHTESDINFNPSSIDQLSYSGDDLLVLSKIERSNFLSNKAINPLDLPSLLNRSQTKTQSFLTELESNIDKMLNNYTTIDYDADDHAWPYDLTQDDGKVKFLEDNIYKLEQLDDSPHALMHELMGAANTLLGKTNNSDDIIKLKSKQKDISRDLIKSSIVSHIMVDAHDPDNDSLESIIDAIDWYLENSGPVNNLIRINPSIYPDELEDVIATLTDIKKELTSSADPYKEIEKITTRIMSNDQQLRHERDHLMKYNAADRDPTDTNPQPYDGIDVLMRSDNAGDSHLLNFNDSVNKFIDRFGFSPTTDLILEGNVPHRQLVRLSDGKHQNIIEELYAVKKDIIDASTTLSQKIIESSGDVKKGFLSISMEDLNPFTSQKEIVSLSSAFDEKNNSFQIIKKENSL